MIGKRREKERSRPTKVGGLFGACELKGKEDWRGTWLERDMIREENDWRGKWVWDNWYFKWSQKTQRWERGTSFPRVTWCLVPQLTKHKRCSSLPTSLSLPTTAAIRSAKQLMSFCNRWLLAGEWLSVPSFSLCFDYLRFFFFQKERCAKNLTTQKQRILWTSLFSPLLRTRFHCLSVKLSWALWY